MSDILAWVCGEHGVAHRHVVDRDPYGLPLQFCPGPTRSDKPIRRWLCCGFMEYKNSCSFGHEGQGRWVLLYPEEVPNE